ncbi:MAG: ABC transporter substrate-binding protein [Thermoprotei archaeon]
MLVVIIIIVAGVLLSLRPSSTQTTPISQTSTIPPVITTSTTSIQPALRNQTLIVDYTSSPGSLDPATDVEIVGFGIFGNILQPLVYYYNSNSNQIVPVVAQNFMISQNGLIITFYLRHNINFSNGDPFNAYCVWYSYYRAAVMGKPAHSFIRLNLIFQA